MAKDKERSVNPAQQQRKLDKAKALKKGKAEVQARRNEKLARRNPERLQRQLDDLKALEASGQIKPREKQMLEELERDVRAIRKARDALGDRAPQFASHTRHARNDDVNHTQLGKRGRDGEIKSSWHHQHQRHESSGSETDDSVRKIPMPEDTPPPIPQRYRRHQPDAATNERASGGERQPHGLPSKPAFAQPVKTTYESAPQIRDLRKEAVSRFVPSVVRQKQDVVKGVGGLLEPEQFDRLEKEGYVANDAAKTSLSSSNGPTTIDVDEVAVAQRLAEEEERFRQEMRQVQIEEVQDEDL